MEDGKLTGLSDVNSFGARYFVAYDGFDVLARVQDGGLINTVIGELASLHIGQKAESSHPDEIDLEINAEIVKDNEGVFEGWAVLIRPEVSHGKKRKSSDD